MPFVPANLLARVELKKCLRCDKIIPKGDLSPAGYARRKFCSRNCADAAKRLPPNRCIDCGKKIGRRSMRCYSCATKYKWKIGVFPKPNPPTCCDCGKKISYGGIQRCNSCASKNAWVLGKYTAERNRKVGVASKQRWEDGDFDDPEVKARQSAGVSAAWERGAYDEEWHLGQSERIKDAWARGDFDDRPSGKQSPSGPESRLMEIFDDWGVGYVFQFPIKHKRFDFFLPSYNLIIEYDGFYWHSEPQYVANDVYKDNLANSMGIDVLRLKGLPRHDLTKDEMTAILMDKFPEIAARSISS